MIIVIIVKISTTLDRFCFCHQQHHNPHIMIIIVYQHDPRQDHHNYNDENHHHPMQEFVVKYLGKKEARGLWGIKHTRKPVDDMVGLAR